MNTLSRRRILAYVAAASGAMLTGAIASRSVPAQPVREIEIVARRFTFTPHEIALNVNERVVLAISSLDFVHGFSIPDLGVHTDLVLGRVTRMELQLRRVGSLVFLCDNFCGDGHEEMHGRIVVSS